MTKHRYYDLIVAMAENTDLILFAELMGEWQQANMQDLLINDSFEQYFVCLPKHKEVCLYWLNGGDIQGEDPKKQHSFDDYAPFTDRKFWSCTSWYMRTDRNMRIKPKKEKRFIAWNPRKDGAEEFSYLTLALAQKVYEGQDIQIIEIEVEV
ncbi:hypothetical protein NVP1089O_54 [Vibrio phage 1.089.O._10N.261.51.F9]|nr:hypothetical protein NVP1012O_54 [Vibrio phage 1.012.O._10N.261.48.C12]AUR86792.1 hypothetical protein NVP1089O_54 [Vibrio phage 1.089.O._10N.261.51.F9]AUR87298.1 hypothetical protein NVP1098O_54 [Vibrio phage 1.098.O._10N.286.51.B9]AUR91403.1 hypothetical protein NVP1160O_54 [Vibrio phage 1.160.O._10N.261.48.B11]AUR97111.1 hypothetical protein NVP1237A_52 [Vibrio phage 1.237.A._10N.261.52.C5]AUR97206.1 hypothetical protein NVP1237B_52 [Vibrio phage 1.237.B._10N.261.52.C5]